MANATLGFAMGWGGGKGGSGGDTSWADVVRGLAAVQAFSHAVTGIGKGAKGGKAVGKGKPATDGLSDGAGKMLPKNSSGKVSWSVWLRSILEL